MSSVTEKKKAHKILFFNGTSALIMLEMFQKAFGNNILSKPTVLKWQKMFKEDKERVEDETCTGRPSEE